MALPKPTFNDVLSHYPVSTSDFGDGGRIVNNPAYEHTCALRLSTALEGAQAGVLGEYPGNRAVHHTPGHGPRITLPFARGARGLASYLADAHVGWGYRRLESRAEAVALTTQGIIFWKVNPDSGSPNHIDLWDPSMRALRNVGGRTMLWAPAAGIVEYAWFWDLRRGGAWSPPSTPHSLQSG